MVCGSHSSQSVSCHNHADRTERRLRLVFSYCLVFLKFISLPLNPIQDRTLNPYFFSHYHLWYLSLLFYFFIGYTLFRIIRSNLQKTSYSQNWQTTNIFLHITSLVVLSATGYALMYFFFRNSWFVVSILQFQISRIIPYICFFILGISAYKNRWLTDLTFRFPELLLAAAVLLTPVLLFFTGHMLGSHSIAGIFVYGLCRYAICILTLIGFLFTVKKYFNKVTSFNRIINRSSFGLYIVHLDVVAFFLFSFSQNGWLNNPVGEMIIIMILSTTIGVTLYFGYSKIKKLIISYLLRC
ncbi:MAG: acyltransferase family protein [Spirochaetes bacterium]|nr:acyltransferase family protein [Spirochaetota bacterium]